MTKSEEKHYQELLAALPGVVAVLEHIASGADSWPQDSAKDALSTLRALLSGKEGVSK